MDLQQLSQQISEGRWNHDTSIDANDMTGIARAVAAALGKLSGSWDSELREFCEPYFNGGAILSTSPNKQGCKIMVHGPCLVFKTSSGVSIFVHNLEGENTYRHIKQSHFGGEKLGSWEIAMEATRNQYDFTATFLKRAANI